MDNFEKALEEIRKEYEVRRMTSTYAQIELDEFFDWHNYIFIGILYLKDSGQVLLTDNADYAPLCGWEEENLPEVEKICRKHHIAFNNWHIECIYHCNQDVDNYLECLRELSEKYADLLNKSRILN